MKNSIKTVISIVLLFTLSLSLAACGSKGADITPEMKTRIESAIRIVEQYLRGEYSYDVAYALYNVTQEEADGLVEKCKNEDNYADMLSASVDITLLESSFLAGTNAEIEEQIKKMEIKYLGD